MADKNYNAHIKSGTIVIATSESTTAGTESNIGINGLVKHIILTTPAMEATDSTKLDIVSAIGGTFCTTGTKAESTTTSIGTEVFVVETDNLVATAEGTQSADVNIVYQIRYAT